MPKGIINNEEGLSMKHGTAQFKPMTPGQVKELSAKLVQAVPTDMSFDQARALIGAKGENRVAALLRRALFPESDHIDRLLNAWLDMYWLVFQIEPDISKLKLPAPKDGFNWLIPCFPEIPINMIWQAHEDRYPCYSTIGDDLEEALPENDRTYKKGPYGIWVRDRVEADKELKELSADVLCKRKIAGITLDERLRLELFYWVRSRGQHLDVDNITLCAGSRDSDGSVPHVSWPGDGLGVYWYAPGDADPRLRAREIVSL